MNKKQKGINAERELIHLFWKEGWAACRTPGSGSIKYPCPDVIAGNNLRKLAIECKSIKSGSYYFSLEDIDQLKQFSGLFNAEPWVGIKFGGEGWFFLGVDDLGKTGKSFLFSLKDAKIRGLNFKELVGSFVQKEP